MSRSSETGPEATRPPRSQRPRLAEHLGWATLLGIQRSGKGLAFVAVADAAGTGLFLGSITVLLVRGIGLTPTMVGVGLSIAGACGLLATVPAGRLADRVGSRSFLIATAVIRALAYGGYAFVDSPLSFVVAASLATVASAGSSAAYQSLLATLVVPGRRVAAMAATRSLRNVGYSVGAAGAAAVLAFDQRAGLELVAVVNAASFVAMAVVFARIPSVPAPSERPRGKLVVLRDGPYLALTLLSTFYAMAMVILDVGIPLWLVERTTAPPWIAAVALVVNTVLVIAFQVRLARGADSVPRSVGLARQSALLFAIACVLFATTGQFGPTLAGAVLLLAAVVLTFGEMLESAAWWTLSFELADHSRRTEYLAAFSLNYEVLAFVGPLAMAVVVAVGPAGWIAVAGVFLVCGGALVPLAVRAAQRTRPDAGRPVLQH